MSELFPAESPKPGKPASSWYEFSAAYECAGNDPNNPRREICGFAVTFCDRLDPSGPGPFAIIYRRTASDDDPPGSWTVFGTTCFPDSVPDKSGDGLTEQMIIDQFHQTDFALPGLTLQPPDQRSLVNLPVYYQVAWPESGFQPQEVDTTAMAGHDVRIRPVFNEATYHFGDGTDEGPTDSLGGPYPSGDVTHTYRQPVPVEPSVSVVYGGEVSVDGDDWETIPASVTIAGPTTSLDVLESRNHLYEQ